MFLKILSYQYKKNKKGEPDTTHCVGTELIEGKTVNWVDGDRHSDEEGKEPGIWFHVRDKSGFPSFERHIPNDSIDMFTVFVTNDDGKTIAKPIG